MTRNKRPTPLLTFLGALLLGPSLLLGIARGLGWIGAAKAVDTLVGILIAAAGGVITGVVAERLLRRGRNGAENLLGVALTTALGVLTIGYLYVVHIQGPMSSIGALDRAVQQVLIFIQYLTAEGAGALLAPILIPRP